MDSTALLWDGNRGKGTRSHRVMPSLQLLVLLVGAGLGAGCGSQKADAPAPSSRPIKVMVVESPADAVVRSFPAVTHAGERSELSFRRAGTIAEIAAVEGRSFKSGELLARLDPRDFENKVAEAISTLASAEAELEMLKTGARVEDIALLDAQLAAAVARHEQAATDYKRQKQMLERGLIPASEFEHAETMQKVTRNDVETATQQLAKARTGGRPEEIRAAEARVESLRIKVRDAEAALDDTTLRAPFDGVVATLYADPFQEVQAKQSLLTFQNIGGLELELRVPESIVVNRRSGGALEFEVIFAAAGEKKFPAEFKRFSTEADPATQTYKLTLGMPAPPELNVFPGMTAEVRVKTSGMAAESAPLLVPINAVGAATDGQPIVWLVDTPSGSVRSQAVKTGPVTGNQIAILEGVKPGDTLATAGVSQLRDGMLVRPMDS